MSCAPVPVKAGGRPAPASLALALGEAAAHDVSCRSAARIACRVHDLSKAEEAWSAASRSSSESPALISPQLYLSQNVTNKSTYGRNETREARQAVDGGAIR